MITKKLVVPLINEKILSQAEHCYIATAAISDAGFDLIRSRIPPKCKMDIVTSLDGLTSPNVLKRIYSHYQGRITLNIYTRNALHANVYVFYLPFRKAVAFVGSGNFSTEGLKDHEELFWKITDQKEIESLMSWFTGYFEFGSPLTEEMIQEYELIYPAMKQREIASSKEKQQLIALTASGFNWDSIKFKNQFFKKEDYQPFSTPNASADNASLRLARMTVQSKLLTLQESLRDQMESFKLDLNHTTTSEVGSVEPKDYPDQIIRSMWISYYQKNPSRSSDFVTLQVGILPLNFCVRLRVLGDQNKQKERAYLNDQMQIETYQSELFVALSALGSGYTLEIAGVRKTIESFQSVQTLMDFIKTDYGMYFGIIIEKLFYPGDPGLSNDKIIPLVLQELAKLSSVFNKI
jgi:HKD family nuclease